MNRPLDAQRKALGKGLNALLPARPTPAPVSAPVTSQQEERGTVRFVSIDEIEPNPLQPRSVFQPERLHELSQSIVANGIIQPLIVLRREGRFQLVAGERRWRAARMAGLTEVPVVIQDFVDDRLLEIALIENIQREDLNPIEVAHAYDRLAREHKLSHEEIGRRTGKDRTSVTNMLRLLKLPSEVQLLLAEHRLSMGHARALLGLPTPELQIQVAEKASAEGLSVRQVERLVQKMVETRETRTPDEAEGQAQDPNVKAAVEELERALGTRVRIVEKGPQRGRIEIEYYSQDELQRLYSQIVGN
ncbi:MAG: ParB/RepB/Spo0J family partition protein [Bryobacteraceae bacterium]|nr:ParB/RepB/Spo0J family partition protein [Bryobacteraceae bacterium]